MDRTGQLLFSCTLACLCCQVFRHAQTDHQVKILLNSITDISLWHHVVHKSTNRLNTSVCAPALYTTELKVHFGSRLLKLDNRRKSSSEKFLKSNFLPGLRNYKDLAFEIIENFLISFIFQSPTFQLVFCK